MPAAEGLFVKLERAAASRFAIRNGLLHCGLLQEGLQGTAMKQVVKQIGHAVLLLGHRPPIRQLRR